MARPKIELNFKSLGDVALRGAGMRALIKAKAEAMAAQARSLTNDEIVVDVHNRKDRVGAYVTRLGSGAAGEANDRALGRSVGGA